MIVRALDRGVSEEKLARALNLDVKAIKRGATCWTVSVRRSSSYWATRPSAPALRSPAKMKPIRQIEVAELMISVNNSMAYVQGAARARPAKPIWSIRRSRKRSGRLTPEQMARLERETAMVNQDFKALEESYGDDVLNLVVASGYVAKLVGNAEIVSVPDHATPRTLKRASRDRWGSLAGPRRHAGGIGAPWLERGDRDPLSAGTAGDAVVWDGSSAVAGKTANPF